MLIPDDERFEEYLLRFSPRTAEPLQLPAGKKSGHRVIAVFARVAVLAVAAVSMWNLVRTKRPSALPDAALIKAIGSASLQQSRAPLTLGSANVLLSQSPSFREALDRVAVPVQIAPLSKGERSAIAELSREKIKL